MMTWTMSFTAEWDWTDFQSHCGLRLAVRIAPHFRNQGRGILDHAIHNQQEEWAKSATSQ